MASFSNFQVADDFKHLWEGTEPLGLPWLTWGSVLGLPWGHIRVQSLSAFCNFSCMIYTVQGPLETLFLNCS